MWQFYPQITVRDGIITFPKKNNGLPCKKKFPLGFEDNTEKKLSHASRNETKLELFSQAKPCWSWWKGHTGKSHTAHWSSASPAGNVADEKDEKVKRGINHCWFAGSYHQKHCATLYLSDQDHSTKSWHVCFLHCTHWTNAKLCHRSSHTMQFS